MCLSLIAEVYAPKVNLIRKFTYGIPDTYPLAGVFDYFFFSGVQ